MPQQPVEKKYLAKSQLSQGLCDIWSLSVSNINNSSGRTTGASKITLKGHGGRNSMSVAEGYRGQVFPKIQILRMLEGIPSEYVLYSEKVDNQAMILIHESMYAAGNLTFS